MLGFNKIRTIPARLTLLFLLARVRAQAKDLQEYFVQ